MQKIYPQANYESVQCLIRRKEIVYSAPGLKTFNYCITLFNATIF